MSWPPITDVTYAMPDVFFDFLMSPLLDLVSRETFPRRRWRTRRAAQAGGDEAR
jgi:hypothetical protein